MKKKHIFNIILLLLVLFSFNSCKEPGFDFTDDPEFLLCDNKWIDTFTDENGFHCEQILAFYESGRGVETIIRHLSPIPGDMKIDEYNFFWSWDEEYDDAIYMDYHDGTTYFYNLHITTDRLSGILGEDHVTFDPFLP